MRTRLRDDRGETTEMVLAVPVLMLLVFLVIQFALWYHAENVAEAAAQEGVRAARALDGSAEAGQGRAEAFIASSAPTLIVDVSVHGERSDETARVEVNGTLKSIIPGLRLAIHAEAESPTERFREAGR